MSIVEKELPKGWVETTMDYISNIITKGSTPTTYGFQYVENGINFVKVENIINNKIDISSITQFISDEANEYLKRSQLREQDILFSIAGTIGRTAIVEKEDLPANTNQAIAIIRCPWKFLEEKFIKIILDSPILFNSFSKNRRGVGMDNVSLGNIKDIQIPLPPLNEQKRIVSKIEELFSLVDSAKEILEKTQVLLKQYRQSLLLEAISGKLTNNLQGKHNEIIKKQKFPTGWNVLSLKEVGEWNGGGTPSKSNAKFWENGVIPWISPKDMNKFEINDSIDKITNDALENSSAKLIRSDSILLVVRSGILKHTLPVAITNVDVSVNQDIKSISPKKFIFSKYLFFVILGLRNDIRNVCSKNGTTVQSIEFPKLIQYSIPLPPLDEQKRIVTKIEESFSLIEKNEILIDQLLLQYKQMKNSILKQAFEGKLVPQDPNDEPAEVLLQRIKEEKKK